MLTITDLSMRYPGAPGPLFEDATLSVSPGHVVPLLGCNGAGKTTLLKIACGLVAPASGTVVVNGCDVVADPRGARRSTGVSLYPERSFYFRLTCRQNLRYYASLRNLFGERCRDEIARMLELTGLTAVADVQFMRLSLGQRKRLGLARSLLGGPSMLLLDEPTANLDDAGVDELHAVLDGFRSGGGAVLFSTHQLRDLVLAEHGHVRIEGGALRHATAAPDARPARWVDVAADVSTVDLEPLQLRYPVRRTDDGIAVRLPVDVGLTGLAAELAELAVDVRRITDEDRQDTRSRLVAASPAGAVR